MSRHQKALIAGLLVERECLMEGVVNADKRYVEGTMDGTYDQYVNARAMLTERIAAVTDSLRQNGYKLPLPVWQEPVAPLSDNEVAN